MVAPLLCSFHKSKNLILFLIYCKIYLYQAIQWQIKNPKSNKNLKYENRLHCYYKSGNAPWRLRMITSLINTKKYGKLNWQIDDKNIYREFSASKEATEWGMSCYKSWADSYKKTCVLAKNFVQGNLVDTPIECYCGYSFKQINTFLRHGSEDESNSYKELSDILAIALCSAPRIPLNLVVYRLVCPEFIKELIEKNKSNVPIPMQEKGFMSTSLLKAIVNSEEPYASANDLLKIYVDENSIGVYVNSVTWRNEQEFLFPPNGYLALVKYPYQDASCQKTVYECRLLTFDNSI